MLAQDTLVGINRSIAMEAARIADTLRKDQKLFSIIEKSKSLLINSTNGVDVETVVLEIRDTAAKMFEKVKSDPQGQNITFSDCLIMANARIMFQAQHALFCQQCIYRIDPANDKNIFAESIKLNNKERDFVYNKAAILIMRDIVIGNDSNIFFDVLWNRRERHSA